MSGLLARERVVMDFMLKGGSLDPEEALAAVVWPTEDLQRLFASGRCVGCGCDLAGYVRGCANCRKRRYARDNRPEPVPRYCRGCGCHIDSSTRGCKRCINRASRRRVRARQSTGMASQI